MARPPRICRRGRSMHTWYPLISTSGVVNHPTRPVITYLFRLYMHVQYCSAVSGSVLVVSDPSRTKAGDTKPWMFDADMTRRIMPCHMCQRVGNIFGHSTWTTHLHCWTKLATVLLHTIINTCSVFLESTYLQPSVEIVWDRQWVSRFHKNGPACS